MAKITLYGMEAWLQNENKSLFDNLTLPANASKETFADSLIAEAGEFAVLYADPYYMQDAIGKWGVKMAVTLQKWFDAWLADYDPLHNYDKKEEVKDTDTTLRGRSEESRQDNTTETHSGVTSNTKNQNNVSAYDEDGFSPHDEQVGNVSENSATGGSSTGSGKSQVNENESHGHEHTARLYGNIGVTTSQQMLESEMKLRGEFNPYDLMIKDFMLKFLVPVYD